jgi:hypothetical protein
MRGKIPWWTWIYRVVRFTHSIITSSFSRSLCRPPSDYIDSAWRLSRSSYYFISHFSLSYVRVTNDLVSTINLELCNTHTIFLNHYRHDRCDVLRGTKIFF